MEERKNGKNGVGIVICLFIILILILALIGMWYYYNIIQKPKVESGNTTNLTSQYTSNNTNSSLSDKQDKSLRINENKDWVYDAEYEKNVTATSYTTNFSETYYAKDIVVPYINVNSSYANSSNNDIKEVFDDAIKNYNDGVNNKTTYVEECNYKKYINNDKLSIVLTYGVGATATVHPDYYTYNIDLKIGNKVSFEDLCTIAGFDSNSVDEKVNASIAKYLKEKYLKNEEDTASSETYISQSSRNYQKAKNDNSLKYFLSDNGKLNVVVELSVPVDHGSFDVIIPVE